MALSVGAASAATLAPCQSGDYTQGLVLTCGDKTFADFMITGDNPGLVSIFTEMNNGIISLNFGGSFFATSATGPQDYQIRYSAMTDGQWLISEIGQAMTPSYIGAGGLISIGETVRVDSFGGASVAFSNLSWQNATSCLDPLNDCEDPAVEGDQLILLNPDGSLTPLGQEKVYVTKVIQVRAFGCDSVATSNLCDDNNNSIGATVIRQSFTQIPNGDIPPVPEPATMLLFSTALLGIGLMRRKKS